MNILFVCSANKQRSKTGEDYFSTIYPKINFQSAGTNQNICNQEGTLFLNEEMLTWAGIVFVMENKHLIQICKFTSNKYKSKIIVLSIEDKYNYYQKELIQILIEKTTKYFKI